MAPRGRRGEEEEEQKAFHELGVRGRKTGVFIVDKGDRDEHGMQPLDSIFSSPRKTNASPQGSDGSGSEDMEIASSAGPGPQTLLNKQRNVQYPIPRSRSPVKTHLQSSARRNPHLDRSSPARGSASGDDDDDDDDGDDGVDGTVTRRLNFNSKADGARPARGKPNGKSRRILEETTAEEDESNGEGGDGDDQDLEDMLEESIQMVGGLDADDDKENGNDDDNDVEPEPQPEADSEDAEPVQPRRRGRPPGKASAKPAVAPLAQPPRKRPSLGSSGSKKRRHDAADEPSEEAEAQAQKEKQKEKEPRQAKKPRTAGPAAAKGKAAASSVAVTAAAAGEAKAKASKPTKSPEPRPRARTKGTKKRDEVDAEDVGETSFMALQRGPPMPKSRGLMSIKHDPDNVAQTRSGRPSYRPVDWWRGEAVVVDTEEQNDHFYNDDFVLPTFKEIIRVPEDALPSKRAPGSKTRKKTKASAAATTSSSSSKRRGGAAQLVEEDEELEEWETNPGTITSEVVLWEPEHELYPPAEDEPVSIMEEQIAISADAVQTRDIRDATFRFAKTLTTPFMGAGVVDLPPGAEKRPKNSRKMHMVFFVHYGKVMVSVNEAQFRISAGGMWFVPRGNYYSITNDYENPARVFFSQGSEVAAQPAPQSEETTMVS